jgi:hypothetical protein
MKAGGPVLHPVWACPSSSTSSRTVEATSAAPIAVVVGHQAETVEATFLRDGT